MKKFRGLRTVLNPFHKWFSIPSINIVEALYVVLTQVAAGL